MLMLLHYFYRSWAVRRKPALSYTAFCTTACILQIYSASSNLVCMLFWLSFRCWRLEMLLPILGPAWLASYSYCWLLCTAVVPYNIPRARCVCYIKMQGHQPAFRESLVWLGNHKIHNTLLNSDVHGGFWCCFRLFVRPLFGHFHFVFYYYASNRQFTVRCWWFFMSSHDNHVAYLVHKPNKPWRGSIAIDQVQVLRFFFLLALLTPPSGFSWNCGRRCWQYHTSTEK